MKFYDINPSKITTIHEAIDYSDFQIPSETNLNKFGLEKEKYILSVGHIEPRKNYINLIKAFKMSSAQKQLKLVIVGKPNYKYQKVLKMINDSSNIIHLGHVSFDDLKNLYANCLFHVTPSIYEGFGFPPLEAAAFGRSSLVSNCSSLPEINGNGAMYFNPQDVFELSSKIDFIANDASLRDSIAEKAKANLNRFSWEKTAIQVLDLYKKA